MDRTNTTHTVAPAKEHTHTIILLHGRDSTATEFAAEFFESQTSDDRTLPEVFPNVKWVFPGSKLRNSARFQMDLSQWFDIWAVEEPEEQKELQVDGLRESIAAILDVLREETAIVPPKSIVLGGISQGCATAICALMCCDVRLGGFVGLSGWLPFRDEMEAVVAREERSVGRLGEIRRLLGSADGGADELLSTKQLDGTSQSDLVTPVFLAHARDDEIVPVSNGEKMRWGLERFGMSVEWKSYEDGGHWINEPQGLDDMVAFLRECLSIAKLS